MSWNSKYFFHSKVVGFGRGNCYFPKIALNHARFPVSFQGT